MCSARWAKRVRVRPREGEREEGQGGGGARESYPCSYLVHRITRRSCFPVSEALLSPLNSLLFLVVVQKPATELWCFPSLLRPLGGPIVAMVGPPQRSKGGGAEWRRLTLPARSERAPRSPMTSCTYHLRPWKFDRTTVGQLLQLSIKRVTLCEPVKMQRLSNSRQLVFTRALLCQRSPDRRLTWSNGKELFYNPVVAATWL